MRIISITEMAEAYAACALWSSTHYACEEWPGIDDGTPMDQIGMPLSVSCLEAMGQDCREFVGTVEKAGLSFPDDLSDECIGRDLWLTRNGHGVGFRDRDLGEIGERLADICRALPAREIYLSDDGEIEIE